MVPHNVALSIAVTLFLVLGIVCPSASESALNLRDQAPPEIVTDWLYAGYRTTSVQTSESEIIRAAQAYHESLPGHCAPSTLVSIGSWEVPPPHVSPYGDGATVPYSALAGVEGGLVSNNPPKTTNVKPFTIKVYKREMTTNRCVSFDVQEEIYRTRFLKCPSGYWPTTTDPTLPYQLCVRMEVDRTKDCNKDSDRGNPCSAATGSKHETETDFEGSGTLPLKFQRFYHSALVPSEPVHNAVRTGIANKTGGLGAGWRASHFSKEVSSVTTSNISYAAVRRGNWRTHYFRSNNAVWTAETDIKDQLARTSSGWSYTLRDGTRENYAYIDNGDNTGQGRLVSIVYPTGLSHTYSYYAVGPDTGRLQKVSDPFGNSLSFNYDSQGRLSTLTQPDGQIIRYGYDPSGNLLRVDYPDSTGKLYHYENSNFPNHLTGISYIAVGGTVTRYASFSYDTSGRAISTEHASGQAKFSFSYASKSQTNVKDAAGTEEWLFFDYDPFDPKLGTKTYYANTTW